MPDTTDPDTDELVALAAAGDPAAHGTLLDRHRDRLRRMVAVRMDPRQPTTVLGFAAGLGWAWVRHRVSRPARR